MKNAKNFITDILAFIITVGIIVFMVLFFATLTKICISIIAPKTTEIIEVQDYIVGQGDTLWSIATEYKREKQDIREYVYQLAELNNIDNCLIYPGQTIKIIK